MSSLVFAAPALPLHKAGPYVAAAYIVFVAIVLIYVAIMAVRLGRTQRDLARLQREVEAARVQQRDSSEEMETLA
jgi:HAMP domain-containing protein